MSIARRCRRLAVLLVVGLAGAGCGLFGSPSTGVSSLPPPTALPPASAPPAANPQPCTDATASLRPTGPVPRAGDLPDGSYVQQIYNRGRVIAGIAQDTLMFGYLNPLDNQLEGFDIDLVRQLSQAIFGDDLHVEYRVITPAQSVQVLRDGTVDVVVRTLPMTCSRWQQIAFSSEYFEAGQRVLVPKASAAQGIGDLGKKRVCAAAGTTALENIAAASSKPVPVGLTDQTDCLVQLELGKVDAISTDDVILAGLAAQDPNVKVVGPRFATLPYGIGISQAHLDFVRYVNALLEQLRANGTWTALYNRWLANQLGPGSPPPARYRD
ncbi:MAG TPA: glutamate ABC transporter substrate-binding protein [Candidatus Dormibacteraeota bacterium]|nr:glutamate ABC transporter substrate-binding protein [Candidatus Dormibacteraeota bacterium]